MLPDPPPNPDFGTIIREIVISWLEWLIPAMAIFVGASLLGISQRLWEDKPISRPRAAGAVLLSGFAGFVSYTVLYGYLVENQPLLVGCSLIMGIGGANSFDFMHALLRTLVQKRLLGGANVQEQPEKKDE